VTAEERYIHDPVFRRLVDTIYEGVCEKQYTPTEVRDAAMLAALKYEQTHLRWISQTKPSEVKR